MKLLVLDASTSMCSVAIEIDNQILQTSKEISQTHSQHILPMIDSCLRQANIQLDDLDACVFGKGPGSFTGLRLAASLVQAISYSCSLPVIPVSSLHAMAQTIYLQHDLTNVLICEDARIQQVYWCHFQLIENYMQPVMHEMCSVVEDLLDYYNGVTQKPFLIGSGWPVIKGKNIDMENALHLLMQAFSISAGLLSLGKYYLVSNQTVTAEFALPSYVQSLQYQKKST